ncbi:CI-B8 domain-containing protein [Diplogelasinospora grovesii]|uniref:CI-B8 domain-containing protein n=1 Tax=Diplogelasinospora grovesii TaxID=303347 RepID=A0AAN6NI09_9PEZI|nr:CI-B8 domain-containing protein [Diplogelasinospora grovesii]
MVGPFQLLGIRHGPGAAILPTNVTRIHMEFAHKINDGHMGPKKFWREHLPRLKFWNPAIPMIVNRTTDQLGPATMTLYFRDDGAPAASKSELPQPSSSSTGHSKAPEPSEGERAVTIDMKNRRSEVILKDFMDMTGAVPVIPTPQEEAEMRDAAELKQRGEIDRERVRKMLEAERREAAMISQARSEAAALKAAA